jgi:hypothetical protein
MSIAAEKVAKVLALPEEDRAYLARQLIASLDQIVDADAETQWQEVVDRWMPDRRTKWFGIFAIANVHC